MNQSATKKTSKTLYALIVLVLLGVVAMLGWYYHINTPGYLAKSKLQEAGERADAGQILAAATLYAEVAGGSTEYVQEARSTLRGLMSAGRLTPAPIAPYPAGPVGWA